MSFEDRMKFYKERYGSSQTTNNGQKNTASKKTNKGRSNSKVKINQKKKITLIDRIKGFFKK